METRTKKLTKITLKPTPNIVKAAAKVERKHTEGYESEGGVRATRRKSNMVRCYILSCMVLIF